MSANSQKDARPIAIKKAEVEAVFHSISDWVTGFPADTVRKIAGRAIDLLLTGETGTGKTLLAEAIHYASDRARGPFVKVNCAAIPPDLMEAEFFGAVKGAFTSSVADRPGLFLTADKGTLFLDEINSLPLHLQAKMLGVFGDPMALKEFKPVGSDQSVSVDVRVIAAANENMDLAVREERFRQDLHARLTPPEFHLVPLRDRSSGSILQLAEAFVEQACAQRGIEQPPEISPDAKNAILAHSWPTNVRGLQKTMHLAAMTADPGGKIDPSHLHLKEPDLRITVKPGEYPTLAETGAVLADVIKGMHEAGVQIKFPDVLSDLKTHTCREVWARCGHNANSGARYLGLHRNTFNPQKDSELHYG